MKNGIYRGDYGISYFVLNDRILMKHLGQMYTTTKHFMFGEYYGPLTKDMRLKFKEVYNDKIVKKW